MTVACVWAAGMLIDRHFMLPLVVWFVVGIISFVAALLIRPIRVPALYIATLLAGAAWHADGQRLWNVDDIASYASLENQLCQVEGIVVGEVTQTEPDPSEQFLIQREEIRTRFTLDVTNLAGVSEHVGGRAIVHLAGPSGGWRAGDHLSLTGWLARPRPAFNLGESSYAEYLRDQRIGAVLYTEAAERVVSLPMNSPWTLGQLRDSVREWGIRLIHSHLSDSSARVAEAFLLGIRSSLSPADVLPFIESGTIHVLVVSGLHVALVSHLFWLLASFVVRSVPRRAWVTMAFVLGYTFVTGANPPALRAAVVSMLVLGTFIRTQSGDPINTLGASVFIVLLIDPGDLFRTGPQLSFLCATAILVLLRPSPSAVPEETAMNTPRVPLGMGRYLQQLVAGCLVLWLMTAPLVASQFHLFSPISVLASIVLIPLSEWALGVGVAFLALGNVPGVNLVLGRLLEAGMWILTTFSQWAASVEWGSLYLAGPDPRWVAVWYLVFLSPWILDWVAPLGRKHLAICLGWLGLGLMLELWPSAPPHDSYHQLAVGHGNAGILRTRRGQTFLFDCGSVAGPRVTDRVVAPWLWHQGARHLDGIFLSHADIDHFNGVIRLARRFSIRAVYVAPSFLDSTQPGALKVLEELWSRQIPIRVLAAGDLLEKDGWAIRCLHPPTSFRGKNDNAESLVLTIENQGKVILLTGDVESDGLDQLTRLKPIQAELLIAPHHGAAGSNTPELAAWCRPSVVVSSQGLERRRSDTLAVYRDRGAKTLSTDSSGEVEFRFEGPRFEVRTARPTAGFEVMDQ
jgi:competence protein ComEC